MITHPAVWREAERKLEAKRPAWLPGLVTLQSVIQLGSGVAAYPDVRLPTKGQPVLAAAIAASADRLVMGDRTHFGPLFGQIIECLKIVSTRMMAVEMREMGWISRAGEGRAVYRELARQKIAAGAAGTDGRQRTHLVRGLWFGVFRKPFPQ